MRGRGGNWIQTRIKSREWYIESSSFFNNLMKRQSFRAMRGGGGNLIQTRIKSREWYIESSSFFNNLMKRQSFRATRGGRGTWFKQGLRVDNGPTNRLLSLIINEMSKLPRFAGEGGNCSLPAPNLLGSALCKWFACSLYRPLLKWNPGYALGEGVQPATRFYLLVALIHCRKYFGTYHPPPPNHGYKSTPLFATIHPGVKWVPGRMRRLMWYV